MPATLNPAITMMTLWYSVSLYKKFAALGDDKAREIADAASEISLRTPLLDGSKEKFSLPYHDQPVSTGYVATAMSAFLVWTTKGENLPDSPLLGAATDGYKLYKLEQGKQPKGAA